MKGKTVITTLFIAILGALIGLFVYTRFLEKDRLVNGEDNDKKDMAENARYTSLMPLSIPSMLWST
jgi:H+/gluconate symporter-like permease